MLKIIGAVLIIASTAVIGFSGVIRLNMRVKSLEALSVSLDLMKNEICSRFTPMREVLEMMTEEAPEPARKFFGNVLEGMERLGHDSFFTIWRDAVNSTRELLLTEEEARVFSELGLCLGRYDVKEQAETISRVGRRMDTFLKRADEERRRDSRTHALLGVTAGIFAVIVLI